LRGRPGERGLDGFFELRGPSLVLEAEFFLVRCGRNFGAFVRGIQLDGFFRQRFVLLFNLRNSFLCFFLFTRSPLSALTGKLFFSLRNI